MHLPAHHTVGMTTCLLACMLTFLAAPFALAHDPSHQMPASAAADARTELADESAFIAENDAAMSKMMSDMAVAPTGDVDRDFVAIMIPHHQGAIDMALTVLRHGRNEQLKRLAQEIIVTQQQEIAAMRLAVGQSLPPSMPVPTQPATLPAPHHHSMSHTTMPAGTAAN